MSTSETQPALSFSELVGSSSRTRLLEYLAASDEPVRQFEIADELGVSQASVSRAATELLETGVVTRGDGGGLVLDDDVARSITKLHRALSDES